MKNDFRIGLALGVICLGTATATAQGERYELGQRLKAFEQAWDATPNPTGAMGRGRALKVLPSVTPQFFSLKFGEAGRTLDTARWLLKQATPAPADVEWAEAIFLEPASRMTDGTAQEFKLSLSLFYPPKEPRPDTIRISVRYAGQTTSATPTAFPAKLTLPLPALSDDTILEEWLTLETTINQTKHTRQTRITRVPKLTTRLETAKKTLGELKAYTTIEQATAHDLLDQLTDLADGTVPETDLPAKAWLEALPKLLAPTPAPWLSETTRGDRHLSLPIGKRKTQPLRVWLPEFKPNTPTPIVIALHGAGGTENLFFEGYGDGHIVKECRKRNWILVAPRSGLNFGGGPPVGQVLDMLAKRLPIDRTRVYIVGHSMGAAQTVAVCQANPELWRAAAALGGGGRVSKPEAFAKKTFYVGVGSADFALSGARALGQSLKAAGTSPLTVKEFPDLEHLVIVREALPEVFDLFERSK